MLQKLKEIVDERWIEEQQIDSDLLKQKPASQEIKWLENLVDIMIAINMNPDTNKSNLYKDDSTVS